MKPSEESSGCITMTTLQARDIRAIHRMRSEAEAARIIQRLVGRMSDFCFDDNLARYIVRSVVQSKESFLGTGTVAVKVNWEKENV